MTAHTCFRDARRARPASAVLPVRPCPREVG
ncbi:hypothetical protein HNR10_005326 [Nocardiopsis aegyptia]|uniref:Uncharacterized protein n=1 Tax=Nocardiopsis aegyptia TaxID=220378 RepID=A0A7Z0ESD9_9ACTN|nr:hypothetical protein [Nocardiopsis aegyptia]